MFPISVDEPQGYNYAALRELTGKLLDSGHKGDGTLGELQVKIAFGEVLSQRELRIIHNYCILFFDEYGNWLDSQDIHFDVENNNQGKFVTSTP